MLRFYVFLYILLITVLYKNSLTLCAQESQLVVESFMLEDNSLTAKNNPVYDNNQQKCALIIVSGMGDESLRFNVGNSFIKVEEKMSEGERIYLVWVPEGVVKTTISSDSKSFKPIEYFFNPRVKKAETYLMKLNISRNSSSIGKQYLEFQIEPSNAYLEVNGEPWTITDGIAYKQVPKGKYTYRVQAKDYHTENGIIDFKDLSTKQTIEINLKPNFGWLNLVSGLNDVKYFIDDEVFNGDITKIKLSSGRHVIRAVKEMYLPFTKDIEISDNDVISLPVELKPNFAVVKIKIGDGTNIFIDEKLVANGEWNGPLSPGSYKIELKKNGYKTQEEIITIDDITKDYNFKFKDLSPIYGSVSIESKPVRASISIDGKEYGKTPLFIPELIIGSHNIVLALPGYDNVNASFEVTENNQTDVSYELKKSNSLSPKSQTAVQSNDKPSKGNSNVRSNNSGKKRYGCIDMEKVLTTLPQYANLQRQIQTKTNNGESSNDIETFRKKELDKIYPVINQAIQKVSSSDSIEIVFPTNLPLYIGSDVIDITDKVIKTIKK